MIQLKTHFFLFLLLTILASCKEDDDKPDKPNYGAEYFKCKVNGVEFETPSDFSCNGKFFDYYPDEYLGTPVGYMVMGGEDCYGSEILAIRVNGLDHTTGTLNFLEPAFADSIFPFYMYEDIDDSTYVILETLVNGEMNIIDFIPRQDGSSPYGSFKGTFHFTLTDSMGIDTIRVTDGSFRFNVPQIF